MKILFLKEITVVSICNKNVTPNTIFPLDTDRMDILNNITWEFEVLHITQMTERQVYGLGVLNRI